METKLNMKQVIANSSGALVIRSPKPSIPAGWVLVRTRYSMISIGTEIAPLRALASQTSGEQAYEATKLALRYLGKAARNPKKAIHKSLEILQNKTAPFISRLRPKPEIRPMDIGELAWQFTAGVEHESREGLRLRLVSDTSEFGYQARLGTINIPEGSFPLLRIGGTVEGGSISVGVLDASGSSWLVNHTYSAGPFADEIGVVDAEGCFQVIISNACSKNNVRLELDDLRISFMDKSESPYWRSEMSDQGWGLGYSASGEIVACGEGVTDLSLGQEVACCGAGWANHAEYIAVPRNMVCPVPKGCSLAHAASTTIGSIAMQGVRRTAPALGERVAVIGLGLIGLITVQLLKASGCTVLGFDLSAARVEKGKMLGMDHGSNDTVAFAAMVKKYSDNHGADKVVIAAATKSNAPINQAMEIVRSKGTVILLGDVGLAPDRPQFYRKEVNLLMSTSYGAGRYDPEYEQNGHDYPYEYVRWTINRNMQTYMEQIAAGTVDIGSMIEHIIAVDDARAAYAKLAAAQGGLPLGVLLEYPNEADPSCAIKLRGAPTALQSVGAGKGVPARVALVGVGAYGTSMIVPKMQALPKYFTLSGIVSADAVRGGNYARQMRVQNFSSSIEEMAANPDIDLLVLTTRHKQHAKEAEACLRHGKAVFVEKPLVTTWADLKRLKTAYTKLEQPPLIMVGFNRRFSPAVERLRAELQNRTAPLMILYRLNGGFIPADHWLQKEDGAGRNIGEACHMYDVFRALAGAPVEEIHAVALQPESAVRLRNDNFTASLRYGDGTQATLMYTASGPKSGLAKERVEIFCDGEAYIIDDYKKLTRTSDGAVLWEGETDKGHAREFELLGTALAGECPAPIPFEEIMETSAVALYVEDLIHGRMVE